MSRLDGAREKVVKIFEDSEAMPGNKPAFEEALREYAAAIVEQTIETLHEFHAASRDTDTRRLYEERS